MQAQGLGDGGEIGVLVQVLVDQNLASEHVVETIKIGKPIQKKEEAKKEEQKGDIELSSDGLLIQDLGNNGEFSTAKPAKKRKILAEEAKTSSSVKSSP